MIKVESKKRKEDFRKNYRKKYKGIQGIKKSKKLKEIY